MNWYIRSGLAARHSRDAHAATRSVRSPNFYRNERSSAKCTRFAHDVSHRVLDVITDMDSNRRWR